MEEVLRRAMKAGREPGCYFGGITLKSGRRGFAEYKDGKRLSPLHPNPFTGGNYNGYFFRLIRQAYTAQFPNF